jgi:hypothetical protein
LGAVVIWGEEPEFVYVLGAKHLAKSLVLSHPNGSEFSFNVGCIVGIIESVDGVASTMAEKTHNLHEFW